MTMPEQPTLQEVADLIARILLRRDELLLAVKCDDNWVADVSYHEVMKDGTPVQEMTMIFGSGRRAVVQAQPSVDPDGKALQLVTGGGSQYKLMFAPIRQYLPIEDVWNQANMG